MTPTLSFFFSPDDATGEGELPTANRIAPWGDEVSADTRPREP